MLLSNIRQLESLEETFHVIRDSTSCSISANARKGVIASVRRSDVSNPSIQELMLSADKYGDKKELIKTKRKQVKDFWCLPCDGNVETIQVYTITHEYGHMLHNVLAYNDMTASGITFDAAIDNYCKEIVDIAKRLNPDFNYAKELSGYGHKNQREFFAEVFANSRLGKPNTLGKAMHEWLKRKGYDL